MTNERMRVLIVYDGSAHAAAALDDLRRAGLPRVLPVEMLMVVFEKGFFGSYTDVITKSAD